MVFGKIINHLYNRDTAIDRRETYKNKTNIENTLKLREVLKPLPGFARDFFRGISTTTATSTRIKYAYDIRIFFSSFMNRIPSAARPKLPI